MNLPDGVGDDEPHSELEASLVGQLNAGKTLPQLPRYSYTTVRDSL